MAGDIDQDSYPDLVVGGRESVSVYSGVDGAFIDSYTHFSTAPFGDGFGASVHGGGDINGDGWPDYVVGASSYDGVIQNGGFVAAFSGRDHTVLWIRYGAESGDYLGGRVAILGDLDGDSKAVSRPEVFPLRRPRPGGGVVGKDAGRTGLSAPSRTHASECPP